MQEQQQNQTKASPNPTYFKLNPIFPDPFTAVTCFRRSANIRLEISSQIAISQLYKLKGK